MPAKRLNSFKPLVDRRSRILVLGTMPGPTALAKREYYGFSGNHFWKIIADLFHGKPFTSYTEKIRCLKKNRIALWDTIETCHRSGASDGAIKHWKPNDIPGLLKRYPNIKTVILNGRMARKIYGLHFENKINRRIFVMPSTSPANAAMGYLKKRSKWKILKKI